MQAVPFETYAVLCLRPPMVAEVVYLVRFIARHTLFCHCNSGAHRAPFVVMTLCVMEGATVEEAVS